MDARIGSSASVSESILLQNSCLPPTDLARSCIPVKPNDRLLWSLRVHAFSIVTKDRAKCS